VSDVIIVDDVALESDRLFGGMNGFKPGGVVLCSIFEEADTVARDKRRSRRARECLVGQQAHQ
jgi:hypothetical protein